MTKEQAMRLLEDREWRETAAAELRAIANVIWRADGIEHQAVRDLRRIASAVEEGR